MKKPQDPGLYVPGIFQHSAKEIVGWKWLQHENLLPFLGVTTTPSPFSMVSPWMENGNIISFLKTTPDQNPFSLVGVLYFRFGNTDLWNSLWMWPMAYYTYTNMTSSTVTSKG